MILWLFHFYDLFTDYLLYEEAMSVRLYGKQTKEQGSEDYLWSHIFTFFIILSAFFLFSVKMQTKQDQTEL